MRFAPTPDNYNPLLELKKLYCPLKELAKLYSLPPPQQQKDESHQYEYPASSSSSLTTYTSSSPEFIDFDRLDESHSSISRPYSRSISGRGKGLLYRKRASYSRNRHDVCPKGVGTHDLRFVLGKLTEEEIAIMLPTHKLPSLSTENSVDDRKLTERDVDEMGGDLVFHDLPSLPSLSLERQTSTVSDSSCGESKPRGPLSLLQNLYVIDEQKRYSRHIQQRTSISCSSLEAS